MADLPHHFIGLPVRPPTPPKEFGSDDIEPNIGKTFESIRLQPEAPYTPDPSPASVITYPLKASATLTKHVGFSPLSPDLGSSGYLSFVGPLRIVPPSRDCISRKSILKSCDIHPADLSSAECQSTAEMLEKLCRTLALPAKSARLDAYMALMSCLKTYKDLPERELLHSKISLLSDFVKRDMSTDAEDIVDTQIRLQSLKLVNVFLADPSLCNLLPLDFQTHLIDRAVKVLTEHTASKAIVNLHLLILATQDFRSPAITEVKALDVLAALEDITEHVKGYSTVGFRQRIYQRLLRQSKSAMIKCVNVWTSHLFSAMLSSSKETRLQALNFGREASMTLGTQSKVSNSVQDIFNQRSPAGKRLLSTVMKRLAQMISNDDEKTDVPHVWGIVVMFLRSRPRQLEHWEYMSEWMGIIQKCFNSSSSMVKLNATLAWSRLVCAVDLSTSTSPGMIHTLKRPIKVHLEQSTLEKTSHRTKQMAYSGYCTLLYYAFRPQRPTKQLDLFWEEFVQGLLMDNQNLLGRINPNYVLEILTHLFDFGQPWNEKRAAEDPPIRPKDLPCLPPSWVHENAPRIFRVFQILLLSAQWDVTKDEDPWIVKAWTSFMNAIGRASEKEIKTSMETLNAVAGMMTCLRRFWLHGREPHSIRLQRILVLWKLANLGNIHPLAITEYRLEDTGQDGLTAVTTPSTRPGHDSVSSKRDSALGFLARLLFSEPNNAISAEDLADVFEQLLNIAISTSPSRQQAIRIIRDVTSNLDATTQIWEPQCRLWQIAMSSLERVSVRQQKYSANSLSVQPTSGVHDIVGILQIGIESGFQPAGSWQHTMTILAESISKEAGLVALGAGFIEPFASRIERLWNTSANCDSERGQNLFRCTMALINHVVWPGSQTDLRDSFYLVWGNDAKDSEVPSDDPYAALYRLWVIMLAEQPQRSQRSGSISRNEVLEITTSLLRSTPQSLSAKVLSAIQPGVDIWIGAEHRPDTLQSKENLILWKACAERIASLPSYDTATANSLEPLFASALRTGDIAIQNEALQLWQKTFGLVQGLKVPESVSGALARIQEKREDDTRNSADGHLPDVMNPVAAVSNFSTISEEIDQAPVEIILASSNLDEPRLDGLPYSEEQEQRTKRPGASIRHTTPKSSPKSRRSRDTPPKRLRHDDSQIVFAAIHSSPYDTESLVSQFLTPHQREVRERQQSEANAMFPDIRSDPTRTSARRIRKLPMLSMSDIDAEHKQPEEWSSPVATKEPVTNDFVQSSPTPGPSRHASSSCLPEDGPPSSPPVKPKDDLVRPNSGPDKELLLDEDQMEGVIHQKSRMAKAINPLVGEDSDTEPSVPGLRIQYTHRSQSMDQDDYVEPALPQLFDQKARVTSCEAKTEIAIAPSVSPTPTEEDLANVETRGQAYAKKDAAPLIGGDGSGKVRPDGNDLGPQVPAVMPLMENSVSEGDIYVDAPSGLSSTPEKGLEQVVDEHLRRSNEEQRSSGAFSIHHDDDAVLDVEDAMGSTETEDERMISHNITRQPSSSDVDEQVSQQIAADMERAATQVKQARHEDTSSQASNESFSRKRKSSASNSPVKRMRKSPRRQKVEVVIEKPFKPSQTLAQEDSTVDENGMLDCIVVATSPFQVPAKKKATPKPKREPTRRTPKSRNQGSIAPSSSQRRCSSRLSQVSSRAGSFYSDEANEPRAREHASTGADITPAAKDRERPNLEEASHDSSSPSQAEDRVTDVERKGGVQRSDLGSQDITRGSEVPTEKSTARPSSSPTSRHHDGSPTAETFQTEGSNLLLRLQSLVQEAKHVVLDRDEQRRLLSTWMDLGQELHHADAESRTTKHA